MSIAVAVRKNQQTVLITDSATTFGSLQLGAENHHNTKVIHYGNSYIASTGWSKYHNILEDVVSRHRKPRQLSTTQGVFRFFHDLWDELHKRYSFVNDQIDGKDSPFGDVDASFLIINEGGIFHVASDLSVVAFDQYFAIGSGAEYALGVCHCLFEEETGERIATRAAQAAVAFDIYCDGPLNQYYVTANKPKSRSRKKK